ncbi:MAG: phosphohydrolase [Parcubacteria group bacterium RIFCSPLOWO2_01_FULL_48_18]|nr:MAG: phosphohydrolase [Parcubacteria group bacterium RIFCSPLOWO2_01_FULL_48_18]
MFNGEDRKKAWELLIGHLRAENLRKHCIAVAAIMEGLAEHFGEDTDKWWIAGLLHDVDYEEMKDDITKHSLVGAQWLEAAGYPDDIVKAVRVHNEAHGFPLETLMEKALFVADTISGLIIAAALILPDKKLASVTPQTVLNRFKEKSFARGIKREDIVKCADINLSLEQFFDISLRALQKYAGELGL